MQRPKTAFSIKGYGKNLGLSGTVFVSGAKNAAIKLMAASILFEDSIALINVPDIEDMKHIGELLNRLGVKIEFPARHSIVLDPSAGVKNILDPEIASMTRSSVVLTGPILARCGSVSFPNPGGCDLGSRPIDLFLDGYQKMGAFVTEHKGVYTVKAPRGKLRGTEYFFRIQSHTGTETLMMAAVLAEGTTVLKNCALEPEVKSLADYLNACGARIKGAGTHTIEIEGGGLLRSRGKVYETIPDRIEAGSFLILGALAAKKLTLRNCKPEHMEMVIEILRAAGVKIEPADNALIVYGTRDLKAVNIRTHEYPGLPTDLQAPLTAFLTQAKGESSVFESIYEGRLKYTAGLKKMGADIKLEDNHRALIKGPSKLKGTELTALDIRSGLAYIVAAVVAEGTTVIHNAYMIDRGYEHIEHRLKEIGLKIERILD